MTNRLLLFTTDLERGGTPTVVRELATRLKGVTEPISVKVEVACLGRFGPVAQELTDRNIKVHAMGARNTLSLLHVIASFRKIIDGGNYDRVLSFLMHANVVAAITSFNQNENGRHNTKWFQSIQTTQPYPWWHWKLQRLAADRARRTIVPSVSVARIAMEKSEIASEKIVVIPNAVDAFVHSPRPLNVDPTRVRNIGFVGRLDPIKRVQDLIDATAGVDSSAVLHVFGDGPERASLEARADVVLRGRCVFHGMVSDVRAAYDMIDVLVLPSDAEGLPMVLIEAMSAGVAVVGAASPGIIDVIEHEETGLLFPPHDVGAMTLAIRRSLVRDEARIARAKRVAADRFGWESVLKQYRHVLELD